MLKRNTSTKKSTGPLFLINMISTATYWKRHIIMQTLYVITGSSKFCMNIASRSGKVKLLKFIIIAAIQTGLTAVSYLKNSDQRFLTSLSQLQKKAHKKLHSLMKLGLFPYFSFVNYMPYLLLVDQQYTMEVLDVMQPFEHSKTSLKCSSMFLLNTRRRNHKQHCVSINME
jgi:hypothetical protein